MKAAILHEFGSPLEIQDVAPPEVGAGEVLIKVEACGVCHSDYHLAHGEWDLLRPITKLPLILGHEVTGHVIAVGDGVTNLKVDERVGVPWLFYTCGDCEYCQSGRETLCPKQKVTGCTVDGGFAELLMAKASHAFPLPANISAEEAAPLLCAGLTVYKSLRVAGAQAGQRLVVFGVGGLGHLAIQLGKARGMEVGAVDLTESKLQLATECGADWVVNASESPAHRQVKAHGGGGDIVMVTSASTAAYDTALRSIKRGGVLAVVGMTPEPISVSTVAMVSGEFRIVASAVGTRQDLKEVLDLAAAGKLQCRFETRPLSEINRIFDAMRDGKISGRIVLKIE
jgi:propanol-preferring alcohol dehydrogenase